MEWEKGDDCWTNIDSPDIVREQMSQGVFGDPRARVISLERRQKKRFVAVVVQAIEVTTTRR